MIKIGFLVGLLCWYGSVAVDQESPRTCHLTGWWKNELNSTVYIYQDHYGVLTGHYFTAVETVNGSAGNYTPNLNGSINLLTNVFSFAVSFANGSSMATWIGECYRDCTAECENSRVHLKTIWVLRSATESCARDWTASRIGRDVFWRTTEYFRIKGISKTGILFPQDFLSDVQPFGKGPP